MLYKVNLLLDFNTIPVYSKGMLTATKIRIYPTPAQEESLAKAFGCARWLWNNSLAQIQKQYLATGKGLGQFALNNRLPALKKEFEWLAEPHSQVLQSVSLNLSRAFVNFFERRARYPRFKSKRSRQTIQYPQGVKIVGEHGIFLPKIGNFKAIIHREIAGKIKTVTVSKDPSGKYFASILTETYLKDPEPSFTGKIIGIDVGLKHIAVTSNGSKFDNPRHFEKNARNLKRKQQKLQRKEKGSNSETKARILAARVYEKIANSRKDFLHKLTHQLVNDSQVGIIAVEDLGVKSMMSRNRQAKGISNAGWNMLASFLEYKSARAGKGFIRIDRFFPSSKSCSHCGHVVDSLPLNIRAWRCDKCGCFHDRDINAAKNIALEAQRMIAAGIAGTANRGNVRHGSGRKSSVHAAAVEVRSRTS